MIAWQGRELTALEPGGQVRWSLSAPAPVTVARWGPVDGFRIAYVAGAALRIVNGDGTGDRRQARIAPGVAPAWRPDDAHVLAFVDGRARVTRGRGRHAPATVAQRAAAGSRRARLVVRRESAARRDARPARAVRPRRPAAEIERLAAA